MAKKKILRCPKCEFRFEVEKPDNLHPHCSTQKPKETEVDGDIREEVYDCLNPKCKYPIIVYRHEPKRIFFKA